MADSPREVLSYAEFGIAVRELAQQVADSGWQPEIVIAIARGGLIPAGGLAYALGTKAAGTLNVEFYTDVEETLPDPVVLEPLLDTDAVRGKRLLVVDDVADSGRTLALVMDLLRGHGALARSAVLYTKSRTVVRPDYSWRSTDLWITFPWSAQPPVEARSAQPLVEARSAQAPVEARSAQAGSARPAV
ncbi:phosphoribosyltransferase [Nakamurella endophytica]|uniref:Phosphoribosyltransferase n=1 Tax=Nakamurella endophytica TaxID=1748367 RepID=A0A917T7V9_9ACTN|nr:phosphoribosyltransferase [Nakamurella endophytica]GGM11062.1 phosphoribosyltransferase [Nakamurella endophytica]